MLVITVSYILVACSVVHASYEPETCSGFDISNFRDSNLTDLAPLYYSYYVVNTQNVIAGVPLDFTIGILNAGSGSNKLIISIDGTNPGGSGCLSLATNGFQIRKNRPFCLAQRGISPMTCRENEWLYDKFAPDKLISFFCAVQNADGACDKKYLVGSSTKTSLDVADIEAFRAKFRQFGEKLPPISDPINNECEKIKKAKQELISAAEL